MLVIHPARHILRKCKFRAIRYLSFFLKKVFHVAAIEQWMLGERYAAAYQQSSYRIPYKKAQQGIGPSDVRPIAFYLPQFHPFLENDLFWGKGFTEWTNTTKAVPAFEGHYQPRLPDELGFYDLRIKQVMERQIEIAKNYGIHGFCFHHYWFMGKQVMRVPYYNILRNPDLDIPFCLHWANEPWTIRWDGYEQSGALLNQKHDPQDDIAFIKDIEPALRDKRYIRIQGRPLLIIYRPGLFPDIRSTIRRWNAYCTEQGIGALYLAVMQTAFDGKVDPREYGFDAAVEFPPHNAILSKHNDKMNFFYSSFQGDIYRYSEIMRHQLARECPKYTLFRGIMTDWDSTPRREDPVIFSGSAPLHYQRWLEGLIHYTRKALPTHERYIFINAWNEWAEGAYLEPDRKYGYGYLQATRNAIFPRTSAIAVVAHLFHDEFAKDFLRYLKNIPRPFDLYVSTRPEARLRLLRLFSDEFGSARVQVRQVQNCGRDMAPFTIEFKDVYKKYDFICWVHSKKKKYHECMCGWRRYLWENLLGSPEIIDTILNHFQSDPSLGIVFPQQISPVLNSLSWDLNFYAAASLGKKLGIILNKDVRPEYPAGSMFWFRPQALQPLFDLNITLDDFEEKSEKKDDGTLAHAIERLILFVAQKQKYRWKKVMFKSWDSVKQEEHS